MPDAPGSTTAASVVFLTVADFVKKPAADQARIKERLEALIVRAIAPLAAADRIVADAVDGGVVAVLGSPAGALQVARRARRLAKRDAGETLALRVGVNHGALRLAADGQGELWLVGDAIRVGASIAGAAEPGRILASRSFRDALEPVDPRRAELLRPAATFADPALSALEIYAFESSAADTDAATGAVAAPWRRRAVVATLLAAAILAAGVGVREWRRAAALAKRPAVVALAISPWGEVLIDGERRGKSPPVTRLEVGAGRHTIEIRHPEQPPVTVQVALSPGEEIAVKHTFAPPPPPPAPAPQVVPTPQPAAKAQPAPKVQPAPKAQPAPRPQAAAKAQPSPKAPPTPRPPPEERGFWRELWRNLGTGTAPERGGGGAQ